MVLETTTLVDRVPLPSVRQARDKHRVIDWLALFQGTCLVLIETAGFAASTLLLVLGMPLFAAMRTRWTARIRAWQPSGPAASRTKRCAPRP